MPNRLAKETSPYLLEHADNPVDWYAWGEEALARARAEQKPIFVSVGYSSCHWCHVMAHESFTMIAHFQDPVGGFYDTSDDHETLITQPRSLQDNATPSGNAMAVTALLKLAGFTKDLRYVDIALQALARVQPMLARYPLGFGQWLQVLSYTLSQPQAIAIAGDPRGADTQALLKVVRRGFRPFQVVALGGLNPIGAQVPLLRDRSLVDGDAAAYLCDASLPGRAVACQAPVTQPEALSAVLQQRWSCAVQTSARCQP